MNKKISIILGTRPEAIKLIPLIIQLKAERDTFDTNVCVTGQHKEMLLKILKAFEILPDENLNIVTDNQTLTTLSANLLLRLDKYFESFKPDLVIVQGDTATVFAASLAAFYHKISVAHIEAGLRTFQKYSPFPEEINRVLTTKIADFHFAPTELNAQNLIKDGVEESNIFVTGNTVIDTLYLALDKLKVHPDLISKEVKEATKDFSRYILVTTHRRENIGKGIENIINALIDLAERYRDIGWVLPVHLNPNVFHPINNKLSKIKNICIIPPQEYFSFVFLMNNAYFVLTDSGGIQEEAPALGKPVLVLRSTTERPEGLETGTVKLIGIETSDIVKYVSNLITNQEEYEKMSKSVNPYGDGSATIKIVKQIKEKLL